MWTVTGAFEGQVQGETNFERVKLIKPGKEYIVGRKDCALVINDRKVSRKHQLFAVGKYSAQDVENPDAIPALELRNLAVNRWVERDGERLVVNAGSSMRLQDGDKVEVLHDVLITVKWEKIVCYCPPSKESSIPSMEECAKLGINVVWKPHTNVTHHVTSELTLDPAVATSLLSLTKFVKPDWLQIVIERGTSSDPSLSLEHEFVLPSPSQHRPTLSASLPASLQSYRSWEPNEARVNIFKPFRFIFVGERGREAAEEYVELVRRGGAGYACCAVQGGRKALHSALSKGKEMGQELVLVANIEAMVAAVGQDEWEDLVREASQYELMFISHLKLVEAVAHIDLSYVNCHLTSNETSDSGSGQIILSSRGFATGAGSEMTGSSNLRPSESSTSAQQEIARQEPEAPPPRLKLVRRAGLRTPSMPPPEIPPSIASTSASLSGTPATGINDEASAAPRRRLVRRLGIPKPTIIGIDDPSIIEEVPANTADTASPADPPPTQSRPNRLKRRLGTTQPPESQLFAAIDASLAIVEPPHKKYKALFEESDPDRITQSNIQSSGSITQPETPSLQSSTPVTSRPTAPSLAVVAEEEEESINPAFNSQQPVPVEEPAELQRLHADDGGNVEMEGAGRFTKPPSATADAGSSGSHTASTGSQVADQASASRPFTSTQTNVDKTRKAGAVSGKPDRDEAFLKAVASTKRGKKHEDDFDREFNELRISKPDLKHEKVKEDWSVLDEFGDDSGLRGNFMVVVDMEVFRKDNAKRDVMRVVGTRADWEGRPNFKKFKKKATGERRKPVELVLEDDESGLSQDPWKASLSEPKSQIHYPQRHRTESPRKKTGLVIDSDEEIPTPKPASRKPPSVQAQPGPALRVGASQKTRRSTQKKANPLFLDSDDENGENGEDEPTAEKEPTEAGDDSDLEDTLTTTGRRTQPTRSNPKKRTAPALLLDEDSDDGATFQGFGSRKKARK